MLKIRLQRVGRKNDASFRVVVTESQRGPKAGNSVEVIGFYDPKRDVSEIKEDRVKHWMSVGAQVSDTVHNLLVSKKIIKGDKKNVLSKKSPIVKEIEADEVKKESSEEKVEVSEAEVAPKKETKEEKAEEREQEEPTKSEEKAPTKETKKEESKHAGIQDFGDAKEEKQKEKE